MNGWRKRKRGIMSRKEETGGGSKAQEEVAETEGKSMRQRGAKTGRVRNKN